MVSSLRDRLISTAAWLVAMVMVGLALYLFWQDRVPVAGSSYPANQITMTPVSQAGFESARLPELPQIASLKAIPRRASIYTIIPNRPSQEARNYTVVSGDSVFEIARRFNITPETLLWANYDLLNDNPDLLAIGMVLKIPPVDGVYYQWQEGDSISAVAGRFAARPEDVLTWPGNHLDLVNPTIEPGAWIMLPGGHREFRQWLIPVIPRGQAGVSRAVYGEGACEGGYDGALGTGSFIWPTSNHTLSGNDYWSGHLGIDLAAGGGAPVVAADSGVIVFSGWATGGYGFTIIIDHGNGYQTLYAHLYQAIASCGRSVSQGSTIGYAGSTGNSTGAHLHFEVRYQGGFVSPWYVLPAP